MSGLLDNPSSVPLAFAVRFSYETPETSVRYVAWESPVVIGDEPYEPLPRMELALPERTGTIRHAEARITMDEVALLSAMRTTFPPVGVTVYELDPRNPSSATIAHKGEVSGIVFDADGIVGSARVDVAGVKSALETTISLKFSRFCAWNFGQFPCRFDREGTKETRTISSAAGSVVTLDSPLAEDDPDWWRFGSVRYRGFEVGIHSLPSPSTIRLVKPPPFHWTGKSVDVLRGCDKTVESCRARGQEENFTGIGRKIPNRDVRTSQ